MKRSSMEHTERSSEIKMLETMMMTMRSPENPPNLTTPTCPTWKLYHNPIFYSDYNPHHHRNQIDLNIAMEYEIAELKAEIETQRRANKKLLRELSEEQRGRESLERFCQQLADEVSSHKSEILRLKMEMEEERKMLRLAEVLREERVRMKMAEAKFVLEEKLSEIGRPLIAGDEVAPAVVRAVPMQRRASPESENPHIKRGINGFVEFPRVVRAIGSKSRQLGAKLECQRAQLRVLLKQRNPIHIPIRSNNLIIG